MHATIAYRKSRIDLVMYFERQRGDNCRIHAINNCFGREVLTRAEFDRLAAEFHPNAEIPATHDYVTAQDWDRTHLLAYILKRKLDLDCFTIGHFELARFRKGKVVRSIMDAMDPELMRFFVCNASHVWCVKHVDRADRADHADHAETAQWLCLDSMARAPRVSSLAEWERDELTLVFPWTRARCAQGVSEMRKLVRWYFRGMSETDIRTSLVQDLSRREPNYFGDCQNWIALFFKFLSASSDRHTDIIAKFRRYESANVSKLDVLHALRYLPDLITSLS